MAQPNVQANLDKVRREIVENVLGMEQQSPEPISVFKARASKLQWTDFDITPEFDMKAPVGGKAVPSRLARKLRDLKRKQISVVRQVVGPGPHGRRNFKI